MKPLLFLTVRSFLNGLRRAVTSPARLISLIAFGLYYFFLVMRPFGTSGARFGHSMPTQIPRFQFPGVESLDAVVFCIFALLTLILAFGILTPKGSFRPADVDVLFPTPISPKLVLIFRIVREYLLTLLVPLFFGVMGWRGTAVGLEAFFRNFPQYGNYTMRAAFVAWLLMALSWVSISYATSLFIGRSDVKSDRNLKVLSWSLVVVVLGTFSYIAVQLPTVDGWKGFIHLAQSPVLRAVFFTGTAATWLVMAPLTGSLTLLLLGLGTLVSIIVVALRLAMTQVSWMYDQAAVKGSTNMSARSMRMKGDLTGIMAERARQGKLKAGKPRWIHRLRVTGPAAMIWKEVLVQSRGTFLSFVLLGVVVLMMTLTPIIIIYGSPSDRNTQVAGVMYLAMQAFGAFMLAMSLAQTGYIELLRRVDLQKPLPFTSMTTVFTEVVAKAAPGIAILWLADLVALIVSPRLWVQEVASMIAMPFLILLICSAVLLMTLLFPDVDDPTQRGFRNLMTLFGIVVLGFPGAAAFVAATVLSGPLTAAVPCAILNLAVTFGVAAVAGGLYSNFNPSE